MIRSLVRPAAWALAAAALTIALLAVPASSPSQAASFTFSDSNCTSFTLVDNGGGNFTLSCQTTAPGTFSCSVGASVNSPTVSQAVTLTATCQNATGGVSSYAWTAAGGNPAGCPAPVQQVANPSKADLAAPGGTTAISNCSYSVAAVDGAANNANANKLLS